MKLKHIALAVLTVISAPSFAAIDDATSGNGELVANFRLYSADNDNNNGGNDISGLFDLGISMNSFISAASVAGYTRTWDLTAANYGSAWSTLTGFDSARNGAIEFNVIALDNQPNNVAGGARYLSTAATPTFASLTNSNLINFQNTNTLLAANQTRGTHGTQADGASTATSGDPSNTYFGKVANGTVDGDNWGGQTTVDTTRTLDISQYFYLLTNSSTSGTAQATRTAFGIDLDGNGTISAAGANGNELATWTVNAAAGTITFANPVPEPESIAMVLAGLGLMGSIVRRRKSKAA
jgi:hypothetical protein